jgi:nucleotidyltransferase substrate binding protein (TIGR01987 family)
MKHQNIRWTQRADSFRKAFSKLKEAMELARQRELSDLEAQGLIQGFVYTHELAWNTLKDFLQAQDFKLYGLRDTTRAAFKEGIIENGEAWMEMIHHRNLTTHIYNEDTAEEVVSAILNIYFSEFETLLTKTEQLKQEESL